MINRSTIKYKLKKILPQTLFTIILTLWRRVFLHIVERVDKLRLKQFTSYRAVQLTHKGVTFSLYISPVNGFIDKHIFLYGVYEPFMLDLIFKYLHTGSTFIDIGANIGQHSMYAASIVGKSGSVHSFEPIPYLSKQLQDSANHDHFESIIHAHNCALGKAESTEKLYVSKNIGGSSLVNDDDTKEIITVHVKNGDEELRTLSSVNLIKIDVEGYEYEVLLGIEKTLFKYKPVILIEFSGEFYATQRHGDGKNILGFLRTHGYSLYDIENNMKQVLNDTVFDHEIASIRKQTNLLCIFE